MIDFQGKYYEMKISYPIPSISFLFQSVGERLGLSSAIEIEYFNENLQGYFLLSETLPQIIQKIRVTLKQNVWWNWQTEGNKNWIENGVNSQAKVLLLKEKGFLKDIVAFDKLILVTKKLGLDPNKIKKAFAISNPQSFQKFEAYKTFLFSQQKASPLLFLKDDWKKKKDAGQKALFWIHLDSHIKKFDWNYSKKVFFLKKKISFFFFFFF